MTQVKLDYSQIQNSSLYDQKEKVQHAFHVGCRFSFKKKLLLYHKYLKKKDLVSQSCYKVDVVGVRTHWLAACFS
jgi:hypothetical protein